jgi:ferredoxin-fold anticodon binding domain-containing protein
MERQHTENLFRRYKGQLVSLKTISGEVHQGYIIEVTNDYVALDDRGTQEKTQTFILFAAIESFVVSPTA